jgi:hypothetical protein
MNTTPLTPTQPDSQPRRPGALQRVLQTVLRVGAGVVAFVLMLAALILGLALAAGVIVWALLRGRRPAPDVLRSTYRRTWRPRATHEAGQVVDVEVREVSEAERH